MRPPLRPADPLRILVDDEGTGVPASDRARIWQAFERLDDRQYHAMTVASLGWAWFSRGNIALATRYAIDGLLESHAMPVGLPQ